MALGGYGNQTIPIEFGKDIHVAIDQMMDRPTGGITVAWDLITALPADVYHAIHEMTFPAGIKMIEYGVVLCKITTTEVQTATISGSPTAGYFVLTVTRDGVSEDTGHIAFNASAADVQAALEANSLVGPGNVAVGRGGSAPNYVYTITWQRALSDQTVTLAKTAALTGGTSPDVAVATTTAANAYGGMYAPYDSGASNGQQTLTPGDCWVLDRTTVLSWPMNLPPTTANHPSVFDGGRAFKARLKVGGSGQPTLSAFRTAFPRVRLVDL